MMNSEPFRNSSDASADSNAGLGIDFHALYHLLRDKLWLIILCVALTGGLGFTYVTLAPKIYSARAVIQVEPEQQKIVKIEDVAPEDLKSAEALKTIEQSLSSRTLMLRIVKANKLDQDPEFAPPKATGEPYKESELISRMSAKVSAKLRRGTRLIDISVYDSSPERAAQLAQSVVHEFIQQGFDDKSRITAMANEYLLKEAEQLKARMQKAELGLQEYREQHNAISLEEKQNTFDSKLKSLDAAVTAAKNERLRVESDISTIQKMGDNPEAMLLLSSVANRPEVMDMKKVVSDKEAEFAAIKKRYLHLHPQYIKLEGEVNQAHQSLDRTALKAAEIVLQSYDTAKQNEEKLQVALREQEKAAIELAKISIPYKALVRDLEADRALFESVLARIKEMKFAQGIERSSFRLIEAPEPATKPSSPRKYRILAVALMIGFVVSVGLIFLLDAFDTSLRSVDQAEQALSLPALAAVPESKSAKLDDCIVALNDPASAEAEAFRALRTSVSMLTKDSETRSVLFTSAAPGEGKTYCSSNYAAMLAQRGLRTLLIDADLRLPGLSQAFAKETRKEGLSDYLEDKATLDKICQPLNVANLSMISAGNKVFNPAELLSNQKFGELIKQALMDFDRVVIDSAPVNAVSDTLLLVEHVQAVCMVVRARKTSKRALQRACNLLARAKAPIIGFVLNRLPLNRGANYYYYYEGKYASAGVYGA